MIVTKELQDQLLVDNDIHGTQVIPLGMVNEHTKAVITMINGGRRATRRLHEMGFIPGETIEIIRSIGCGPVIVNVKGSRVAIGYGLAMKVMISI